MTTSPAFRERFDFFGEHYDLLWGGKVHTCRRRMEIVRKGSDLGSPAELAVVMSNPGSGRPDSGEDPRGDELVRMRPGDAIEAVAGLMDRCEFSRCVVLNLWDIPGAEQQKLLKKVNSLPPELSIFDPSRRSELTDRIDGVPFVVVAWGVADALLDAGTAALATLRSFGADPIAQWDQEMRPYYVKPRTPKPGPSWVEVIANEINRRRVK